MGATPGRQALAPVQSTGNRIVFLIKMWHTPGIIPAALTVVITAISIVLVFVDIFIVNRDGD